MDFKDKNTRCVIYATLITAIICVLIWGYVTIQRSNYNRYDYIRTGAMFDTKTGTLMKPNTIKK